MEEEVEERGVVDGLDLGPAPVVPGRPVPRAPPPPPATGPTRTPRRRRRSRQRRAAEAERRTARRAASWRGASSRRWGGVVRRYGRGVFYSYLRLVRAQALALLLRRDHMG